MKELVKASGKANEVAYVRKSSRLDKVEWEVRRNRPDQTFEVLAICNTPEAAERRATAQTWGHEDAERGLSPAAVRLQVGPKLVPFYMDGYNRTRARREGVR